MNDEIVSLVREDADSNVGLVDHGSLYTEFEPRKWNCKSALGIINLGTEHYQLWGLKSNLQRGGSWSGYTQGLTNRLLRHQSATYHRLLLEMAQGVDAQVESNESLVYEEPPPRRTGEELDYFMSIREELAASGHEKEWVAIVGRTRVSSGATLQEALVTARERGYDRPFVGGVPSLRELKETEPIA